MRHLNANDKALYMFTCFPCKQSEHASLININNIMNELPGLQGCRAGSPAVINVSVITSMS